MAELVGITTTPCVLALNAYLHSPAGIFIVNNTTIYWTNFFNNTMYTGTLSQNTILNPRQITGGIFNLPNGVSVDTVNNKIYWVNQETSANDTPPLGTGAIYVGDLSDTVISNPIELSIPDDAILGPSGLFINYNTQKIYWTDFYASAMLVGDLSGTSVTNIQVLTGDQTDGDTVFGLPFGFPTGVFIAQTTNEIYWTSYFPSAIYRGDISDTFISNIAQITGPTFSGPNGIFITEGTLSDPLIDVCDATCESCVGLFVQFSDLARKQKPSLDLSNSDDVNLLSNALDLTQAYCVKMDWNNSSQIGGSARELAAILVASDSDLDPIHFKLKQSLLKGNSRDCCTSDFPD